jgi:putative DNA primase/helicase
LSVQANYDDVHNQLSGYGLVLDDILAVGTAKPVRVKTDDDSRERRGWYWLNEVMIDGAAYIVGAYGIYHGNDSGKQSVKLNRDGKAMVVDADLRAAMKARQAENIKRMKAMRDDEAQRAAREAARVWAAYVPAGESDYLARKGVAAHGVRFDPNGHGTMVVPMTDARGTVHGLQIIRGKNRGTKLEKQYFPKGLSKQGHYHLIGGLPTWICLVAEGYATAATLHEATGFPVAVAFDAGNLVHVAGALHKHYKRARLLICADDDYLTEGNPGVTAASNAALAVNGSHLAPVFAADRAGKKITDFNDLQAIEGQHAVRSQIEAHLLDLKWQPPSVRAAGAIAEGGGESAAMLPRLTIDEAAARFWNTYGMGGKVLFDEVDRRLVHKDDVMNLLPSHGWDDLKKHPGWRVVRDHEIGFDPTEKDKAIRCNLFGGWPTVPVRGKCTILLELLFYLCSKEESNSRATYDWILKWLAYPIQHRGAKMQSAIVVHGPQGTGKSRFFEAVAEIYGQYGRVLGQDALEDKFNADWAEKKLFIVGDEVMAKVEMYHVKNRLKGFITGGTIRVNPKNVAAHTEKNQMNIVFLSNERQPLALENDDRRHCVIFTPPKPDDGFFAEVNEEIEAGGVAALHDYLLNLDLGDFRPWTKPPMTEAKQDLIDLGMGSEERFLREWGRLELEGRDGEVLPFCPCLGSHLYRVYEDWCKRQGEFRPRPANHFLNYIGKQPGWSSGKPESTWSTLKDKSIKSRKMVVPGVQAMTDAVKHAPPASVQHDLPRDRFGTKAEWLTACFFEFERAMGGQP